MNSKVLKCLLDALQAIEAIQRFTSGVVLDHYLSNEILQAAIERKFEILGEALKQAADQNPDLARSIPDLRAIIGTRNRIIHSYDAVDQLILWDVVIHDLYPLKASLEAIIRPDCGDRRNSTAH